MSDPQERPLPLCPVCGDEAQKFIVNYLGEIIGCDCCTREIDAVDVEEEIR